MRWTIMPVAVLLLLAACGGGDGEPEEAGSPTVTAPAAADGTASPAPAGELTVASDDGTATLTIPEGALPPGVDASDIRVTTVSIAEPQTLEAADPEAEEQLSRVIAVVELEPAGLRFLRPVTLAFRLPSDIVSGPLVALHASEEGVEPLAITLTDRPESEQIEITATVEHFSLVFFVSVIIPAESIIEAKLTAPESVMVNDSFKVSVDLERLSGTRTVTVIIKIDQLEEGGIQLPYEQFQVLYVLTVLPTPWTVGPGDFSSFFGARGVISPGHVGDKPTRGITVTGDTHYEEATFTCESPGRFDISYGAFADAEYEAMPAPDAESTRIESGMFPRLESASYSVFPMASVTGLCVETAETEETQTEPPPLEEEPPTQVCAVGSCFPCEGGDCAEVQLCFDGECSDLDICSGDRCEDVCDGEGCTPLEVCTDGECVPTEVCRDGECDTVSACSLDECVDAELCSDDGCEEIEACFGSECRSRWEPPPPEDESGTGSTSIFILDSDDLSMAVTVPNETAAGTTYQVGVSILRGPDAEALSDEALSDEVSCTLVRRGDPDGTHFTATLSSDGTATLTLKLKDEWKRGDEVALFCFFEGLDDEAVFVTSFVLQ